MNSDHVQRYHIRQDGLISKYSNGNWVRYEDIKELLNDIPSTKLGLGLKNDSHRHDIVFKGVNITYRLSVKKSHFWIYNRDTGQEIQYISHDSGFSNLHENWESFMEDFWLEILEDMK